jgi:hypothetical protein
MRRIVADKRRISADEAKQVGATLGLDWKEVDLEQFRRLEVELEHGARDPETNVTNDDLTITGISLGRTSGSSRTTTHAWTS